MTTLATRLKRQALDMGFDVAGICAAGPSEHAEFFANWVEAGYAGQMHYLARRIDQRRDPSSLLPGCRSILVVGLNSYWPDEVVTPPLEGTILPGITRDAVLTLLADWGTPASERQLTVEELVEAHRGGRLAEVFGCGTAAVISPVGELGIDGERLVVNDGRIGDLSQRLYDAITAVQYGEAPDTHGWMLELPG